MHPMHSRDTESQRWSHLKTILSARQLWAIFLSLVSFLFLFAIDHMEEESCRAEFACPWYRQVLSSSFWYQVAVTNAGLNKPENSHVALVIIQDPLVIGNVCLKRSFIANLLRTLDDSRSNTIVFDLWISSDRCADEETNKDLVSALEQAHARLVFGQPAWSTVNLVPNEREVLRRKGLQETDLILKPTFFDQDTRIAHLLGHDQQDSGKHPRVTTGLVTLNLDNRRIPLGWDAFSDRDSVGHKPPLPTETLAVASVRAYNRDDPFLSHLPALVKAGKDPFTSFIREDKFLRKSAEELVCKGPYRDRLKQWQERCPSISQSPQIPVDLHNRVIVVGQVDVDQDLDMHDTVVGRMSGVALQGNYIEALLSLRYFRRVHPLIELLIAVVWFWFIDFIFKKYADRPLHALLVCAFANVVAWVIVYHLVILELRYYISMLVPSFLMIAARFIWTFDIREHRRHSELHEA